LAQNAPSLTKVDRQHSRLGRVAAKVQKFPALTTLCLQLQNARFARHDLIERGKMVASSAGDHGGRAERCMLRIADPGDGTLCNQDRGRQYGTPAGIPRISKSGPAPSGLAPNTFVISPTPK
jgi:hypothetical protein